MTSLIPGARQHRAICGRNLVQAMAAGGPGITTPQTVAPAGEVSRRTFQSVAPLPSRRVMRTAIDSAILPRHLAVRFLIVVQGDADDNHSLNFFGPFKAARRFLSSLRHALQKPRRVFAVLFRPALLFALIHGPNHGAGNVGKIRKGFGNEFR